MYVNTALARLNGAPAADHIGRTIAEVVPGIDARLDVLRAVLADGVPRETTSSGQTRVPSPLARRYFHGAYHRLEVDGTVVGIAGIVLEVTASRQQQNELERARERLAMLDSASTRIGTTLDMDTTCVELARFLVPELGDAASVDVLPPEEAPAAHTLPGVLRLLRASLVSVPELEETAAALGKAGEHIDHQPGSAARRALESGRPVIENMPADDRLGRAAAHPDRLAALRRGGVHSGLVVPLLARGRALGTVTLIRAAARRCSPRRTPWWSRTWRCGPPSASTTPAASPASTASPSTCSAPSSPSPAPRTRASKWPSATGPPGRVPWSAATSTRRWPARTAAPCWPSAT
ncbi:PAS domain-containing protein [Kitasatospora arboriphila]